ncbi:hypothetical protein NliqN6_4907 [Naganishia liquefaciens]|uniref:Tetrapyrrole biosynthesis uroporphyrinogen III synthase domain-containing protein n=1 Tax=Naganishia liquefaciens TaxID=104408 RepID=A0A8H3TWH4_9TREE|nr:hypothetical protein NliqN6_4907 [Naganishia liquefaciens]
MPRRSHIVFFRNPVPDSSTANAEQEPYESAASSCGYTPHTQPVLAQEFVRQVDLVQMMAVPEAWMGVVATSKRAGEAWANALRHLTTSGQRIPKWNDVPLYTPGAATTAAFAAPPDLDATAFPTIVAESETTGCAELLGSFIVSDAQQGKAVALAPARGKPLLVLTGDKNSPELADILRRGGIPFKEVQVYRTCPRHDIRPRLSGLIEDIMVDAEETDRRPLTVTATVTVWLAFFSPSSADAVLSAGPSTSSSLPWYEQLVQTAPIDPSSSPRIQFRIAAIGKTTRLYLEQRGFERVVQAQRPNAEALARAIAAGDEENVVRGPECGRP